MALPSTLGTRTTVWRPRSTSLLSLVMSLFALLSMAVRSCSLLVYLISIAHGRLVTPHISDARCCSLRLGARCGSYQINCFKLKLIASLKKKAKGEFQQKWTKKCSSGYFVRMSEFRQLNMTLTCIVSHYKTRALLLLWVHY